MSYYEQMIIEATGCPPEEAPKVETVLRSDVFHSTLDWQSGAELRRGARKAWQLLNEDRRDYEEYFQECRASMGLPVEATQDEGCRCATDMPGVAAVPPEDPPVLWQQKQTIINLVIFRGHQGEAIEQGCRFHLAPCEDGRWFAWAEAHQPSDDPQPCDAFYDFYAGIGHAFATRPAALGAIYRHGTDFCAAEAEDAESEPSTPRRYAS